MSDCERLRDEVLAAIAKSGKAYVNESKAMALELIELRAKYPQVTTTNDAQSWSPYSLVFGGTP